MSNVLMVPTKLYQINSYDGSELSIAGWWKIPKKLFPSSLPQPIGSNFDLLYLCLELKVVQDEESWQDDGPFVAELEIGTVEVGFLSPPIFLAHRTLSIGHLWSINDRRSGFPIKLPVPAYGRATFEGFQNELFTSMLAGIIRSPKATVRWDEEGLVATINFGNTYISTREHAVEPD